MSNDNILYERLNISRDATTKDIKKAYKKMSMKWHPDKNPNNKDEATRMFQEISEAYSILSDPEKREKYDQFGMNFVNEGENNFDPTDIFREFFGNMSGMGEMNGFPGFPFGFSGNTREKQEDCYVKKSVTLKQIYKEEKVKISFEQKNYCKSCDGTKSKNKKSFKCENCDGRGKVMQVIQMGPMVQQMLAPCPHCRGKGELLNEEDLCTDCHGRGYKLKIKNIVIPLKNGLKTGNKIKMENKGHNFKNYRTDLIIEIIEIPDKVFKRRDNDLIIEVEIKLYQALIGFNKIIKHLDDKEIYINYKNQIKEGDIKIIKGLGMNELSSDVKGDLQIFFTVKYPDLNKLPKNESDMFKVLLAKTEKEELENESKIYKNKDNLKKYELIDFNIEKFDDDESDTPNCVQQ